MSGLRDAVLGRFVPDNPATALTVEGMSYSYATLGRLAGDAARTLRPRLPAGPRIAIMSAGTLSTYVALLVALELDGTYIPLDPAAPSDRLRDVLDRARADAVIIDGRHLERVGELPEGLGAFELLEGQWCVPPAERSDAGRDRVARYLLFTSGSTGVPKGIEIADAAIETLFAAMAALAPIRADDVVAQTFDLTFDLAQYAVLATWSAGARLAVLSTADRLQPVEIVQSQQVTYWFSVPSVARIAAERPPLLPGSLGALRVSLFCGEALPWTLAESWSDAVGDGEVWNLYGPTEATIACSAHRVDNERTVARHGVVPLGRAFPGTCFGLLGAEGEIRDAAEAPPGATGELLIGGAQLFEGYLGDPAKTAAAFVGGPGEMRWYRSGDRVEVAADRSLSYLGRIDEQVQVNGYRVEPREVEHRLARALALGADQIVVVPGASDDGMVSELIAAVAGAPVPDEAIRDAIGSALPSYMAPSCVRRLDAFPLNGNGKVDRRRVGELVRAAAGSVREVAGRA